MLMDDSVTKIKKIGLARLAKARSMSGGLNNIESDSTNHENSSDGSVMVLDVLTSQSPEILSLGLDVLELHPPDVLLDYSSSKMLTSCSIVISSSVNAFEQNPSQIPNTVSSYPHVLLSTPSPDPTAMNWSESEPSPVQHASYEDVVNVQLESKYRMDSLQNQCNSSIFTHSEDECEISSSPVRTSLPHSFKTSKDLKKEIHQLGLPQVPKRSRSLSRLSDAFTQVHNVCLLPAHSSADPEIKMRIGKQSIWYGIDDDEEENSQDDVSNEDFDSNSQESEEMTTELPTRKWLSMSHIHDEQSLPMASVRPADVRQKNYLFGGHGSLLGPTELERYFPDRKVSIFIATWNMNGKEPPTSLDDFLLPDDLEVMPDMYVIGTQESDGERTEWEVRLQTTIGPSHVLFSSTVLGILHLTVFIRRDLVWFCSVPEESYYSLRPGTYFKTKGAIAISFQFFGTKMLFVNTHLFAHEEKLNQRIQNYKNIVQNLDLPRNLRGNKMLHKSKDVTHRYDIVFWMGDLNFRLVGDRDEILEKIAKASNQAMDMQELIQYDQLSQSKRKGEVFNGFDEGAIHFAPTFKFDVGTNHYDSSSKQRVPSYTDRILYKSTRDPIKCLSYRSCPLFKTSDHKPVCGIYHFKVRPGKDDVPLAAGLFQRDIYLAALKRRRKYFHQPSSKSCQVQ